MLQFRRNVGPIGILTAGNLVATAVSLITTAYVARRLGPADFGFVLAITAFSALLAIWADLGISSVSMREASRRPNEASEIVGRTAGFSFVVAIPVFLLGSLIAVSVGYAGVPSLWILAGASVLLPNAVQAVSAQLFYVKQNFALLAVLRVIERGSFGLLSVLAITKGWGVLGVIGSTVAAAVLLLVVTILAGRALHNYKVTFAVPDRQLWSAASWFFALALLGFFVGQLTIVILPLFLSAHEIGIFAAAFTLTEMGSIAVVALNNVYFPQLARSAARGPIAIGHVTRMAAQLGLLGLSICGIGFLAAPFVVQIVYGTAFGEAIPIVRILLWNFFFAMVTIPTGLIANATNNQRFHLTNASYMAAINVAGLFALHGNFGAAGAAWILVASRASGAVFGIPLFLWVLRRAGVLSAETRDASV